MTHPEIEIRARLAVRIKAVFYPNSPWSKVVMDVANRIIALRKMAKPFYPHMDEIAFLNTLINYSDQAMIDAFDMIPNSTEGSGKCIKNQPNAIGGLLTHCMDKVK